MSLGPCKRILVTGASGFIGRYVCPFLKERGFFVKAAVRSDTRDVQGADEVVTMGDLSEATDWRQALSGIDIVIHCAGRAHIMEEAETDPMEAFRKVNVWGTKRLAQQAGAAGVEKFIFISSVKVNGEGGLKPYTEKDAPDPKDPYGASKREAEDVLACLAAQEGLRTVILRLPLVYGPGVKANFKNLMRIAAAGFPLPLAGISNRRSFIYLGNLADALLTCMTHPLAVGETFLVSDGMDVSTSDLIKMLARSMNKRAVVFSLPVRLLRALFKMAGKTEELEKLTGSLTVDTSKIRDLLGWKPPFTLGEGIEKTVKTRVAS
jgi:nucleoside-diphosphate-sugar epimerase